MSGHVTIQFVKNETSVRKRIVQQMNVCEQFSVYVQFTVIPSSIVVVEKENVQLSCRASGVPSPLITWQRRDGRPMPSVFRVILGDLHITMVTKQDEGVYECVASNVLGSQTAEATITVNVSPEISHFRDRTTTINESQTLNLPCSATGFPAPVISWYKANDSLPDGRYVYNSQRLSVSDVRYEDRGEYACMANNTLGTVSKRVKVIVQVGPKILQKPNAIEYGYRGHTATLVFKVFAFPPASFEWKKNGVLLKQANSNLTLEKVKYEDSGLYQATAKNTLGTVTMTTFLIARDAVKPVITSRQSKGKILTIGTSLLEICSAVGIPFPTIVWKHNGTTLSSTTGKSLTLNIPSVQANHAGRYTCEASNRFGITKQYFDLKMIIDPACFSYTSITDATRNTNYGNPHGKCDNSIVVQWYRLTGGAGVRMPTSCVPIDHCDTYATGWLNDPNPTVGQGIVSRKVCFHYYSNCCNWSDMIRVRNCGAFYVYEFKPSSDCYLRYCGTT